MTDTDRVKIIGELKTLEATIREYRQELENEERAEAIKIEKIKWDKKIRDIRK